MIRDISKPVNQLLYVSSSYYNRKNKEDYPIECKKCNKTHCDHPLNCEWAWAYNTLAGVTCARPVKPFMECRKDSSMESKDFLKLCKEKVANYFNGRADNTNRTTTLTPDDVFVVWYCKTLQNHKALLGTPVSDGMYYEFTYNGDKKELYMDSYKKWENIKFDV